MTGLSLRSWISGHMPCEPHAIWMARCFSALLVPLRMKNCWAPFLVCRSTRHVCGAAPLACRDLPEMENISDLVFHPPSLNASFPRLCNRLDDDVDDGDDGSSLMMMSALMLALLDLRGLQTSLGSRFVQGSTLDELRIVGRFLLKTSASD